MEIADCEAVKRTVAAGLGVAYVSRHAIALEMAQQLVSVPNIPELRFRRPLLILTRKDARPSAATRPFWRWLQNHSSSWPTGHSAYTPMRQMALYIPALLD